MARQDGREGPLIDSGGLEDFLAAGTVDVRLDDGRVRVIVTPLPGRTACVAMRDADGVLWLLMDDMEPWARGQAAEMLADAGEGCPERVRAMEAELRAIPTRGTWGSARMALVA